MTTQPGHEALDRTTVHLLGRDPRLQQRAARRDDRRPGRRGLRPTPASTTRSSWSTTAAATAAGTSSPRRPAPPRTWSRSTCSSNYGQHHANLAGLREATGDYVITMDDDLQNPPDQALLLIDEAMTGNDVVFGQFERKQAAGYRRLGSKLISAHQPADLRPARRPRGLQLPDPAPRRRRPDLRLAHRPPLHHRPGAACTPATAPRAGPPRPAPGRQEQLQPAPDPAPRADDPVQLLVVPAAVRRPGRLRDRPASACVLGGFYLLRASSGTPTCEGWTTLVVLLSIFNGFTIALLSMLGEYVVRTLNAVSSQRDLPRHGPGARVTRHLLVIGRPALRHDVPPRPAARTPARSPWRARPGPSRRSSSPTSWPAAGVEWYRATYFGHADRRATCSARRAPATSSTPRPPSGRAADARRPAGPGPAARPVQRAVSHWRFSSDQGLETRPLETALDREPGGPLPWDPERTSVSPFAYLERGRYVDHLRRWLERFGDAVTVSFLEELVAEPQRVGDLYRCPGRRRRRSRRPARAAGQPEHPRPAPASTPVWSSGCATTSARSDAALEDLLGRALPWAATERDDDRRSPGW